MALPAPSECLAPLAEYTFPKHPQPAHVARPSIIPIRPREPTLEPCPKLPAGPVHPLPPGLFDLLPLLAKPCGDRLAPHRQLAWPRLPTSRRTAEAIEGFRFPLTTPLAPCTGPTPALNETRLGRVQCAVKPGEAVPQGAQKLLGVVFGLEANKAIVAVPHDNDISPCMPAAPLRGPAIKALVQGEVREERTGATPLRRPCGLLSPGPILQPALSH
jgi:hypothetical protein